MTAADYISKLEKRYNKYLKDLIAGNVFEPIVLTVKQNNAENFAAFNEWLAALMVYNKKGDGKGWELNNWKNVSLSQKKVMGAQVWPQLIKVKTEEDFLFLINKEAHNVEFKKELSKLLSWNAAMSEFLLNKPERILKLKDVWDDILRVVEFLISNDVSDQYSKSIPLPVNTKFLQTHEAIILELLHQIHPERFIKGQDLEDSLSLRKKPFLFKMRWLDKVLAVENSDGMEVFAVSTAYLKSVSWRVQSILFVENETNLYMLPEVEDTLAIFSAGKALHLLKDIPLFHENDILYWGDLDEDGFMMLNDMRKHYSHVSSVFMDEETVNHHQKEIIRQPHKYRNEHHLEKLTDTEMSAFIGMKSVNGRIEQERLQQSFVNDKLLIILKLVRNNRSQ